MEIIIIIFILNIFVVSHGVIFYILMQKELSLKDSVKATCISIALNKMFFTGSGYLASSYFCRNKDIVFTKTLTAFLFLELSSVAGWILLGIYFGAELAIKLPMILVLAVIGFAIMAVIKKNRFCSAAKKALSNFKNFGNRLFAILPIVVLNMAIYTMYYHFLFNFFDFHLQAIDIIKIIAVSFTVGYLSFAPSGIGFKDTGLVLLLTGQGIPLDGAIMFALTDRLIVTVFWIGLGSFAGFDLIKLEFKKRFQRKKY